MSLLAADSKTRFSFAHSVLMQHQGGARVCLRATAITDGAHAFPAELVPCIMVLQGKRSLLTLASSKILGGCAGSMGSAQLTI